jgi:hypothetical protein
MANWRTAARHRREFEMVARRNGWSITPWTNGEADIKTPYGFTAHVTEYAAWRIGPMTSGTGPYELEALLNTPLLIGCTTLSDK